LLHRIEPQTITPGSVIRLRGIFKTKSQDDVYEIKIGKLLCEKDEFANLRELNVWGWDFIECTLPFEVPGGTQLSSIKSNIGDATKAQDSLGYTWSGEKYDIKIVPQIDSLSVNAGSIQGQRIIISGTGFSKFPSEVEVRVGGVSCQVLRSSITEIECEVDPQQAPVPLNAPVVERKQTI
jgi:hypothetical protein